MTSSIDIDRSANELIKQCGDAADIEAAMRADERLAAGDMEGKPCGSGSRERLRSRDSGNRATEPYTDACYSLATSFRAWLIHASTLVPRDNLPSASRTCSGLAAANWA